jgi:hypothetical protein
MDWKMKFMIVRFQLFLALVLDLSLVAMAFTHHDPGKVLGSIVGVLNGIFFLKDDILKGAAAVLSRIRNRKMNVKLSTELCARDPS